MRTCGVEITGSDVLLCILSKDNDVFDIRDVRQTRFTLGNGNDTEVMRKFQFDLDVRLFTTTEIKEQVKRNPIPIDFEETGLKKYQENAFVNAYVYIMKKTYRSDEM